MTRKRDVSRRKELEPNALVFTYVTLAAKVTTKLTNALERQLPVCQVDSLGPTLRPHHALGRLWLHLQYLSHNQVHMLI